MTTQCTFDGNMVIAVSSELTRPSLLLNSVSVIGLNSCSGLTVDTSNSFVVFKFPLSCTTANQVGIAIVWISVLPSSLEKLTSLQIHYYTYEIQSDIRTDACSKVLCGADYKLLLFWSLISPFWVKMNQSLPSNKDDGTLS